jgi:hypothetical protein
LLSVSLSLSLAYSRSPVREFFALFVSASLLFSLKLVCRVYLLKLY